MNKNHIIIIILTIIIIALIALITVPLMNNEQKEEIKIYNNTIEGVGTFNTINVTNFTLKQSDDFQTDYLAYDENGTRVAQVSECPSSDRYQSMEITKSISDKVNDSAKGHSIYKTTSNQGEHKGEVIYLSYLDDEENNRIILISSRDYNLTSMMVDSFRFL